MPTCLQLADVWLWQVTGRTVADERGAAACLHFDGHAARALDRDVNALVATAGLGREDVVIHLPLDGLPQLPDDVREQAIALVNGRHEPFAAVVANDDSQRDGVVHLHPEGILSITQYGEVGMRNNNMHDTSMHDTDEKESTYTKAPDD